MGLVYSNQQLRLHLSYVVLVRQPLMTQRMTVDLHAWCLCALVRQLLLRGLRIHMLCT
jgi:hypothetical protein